MKFETAYKVLKGIPFISEANAKELYDFIINNNLRNCLELGFAHGVASCYMAAAIDELGGGKLTSVDLIETNAAFDPPIEKLLAELGLEKYVEIHRMQTGYNWFLHNDIKAQSQNSGNVCQPKYDFCIIDGPKNWTIDSSAFFLCDKLLKENGWLIFDDYEWTYVNAASKREVTDGITHRSLSQEELVTPQVKEIFNLLVMQHPNYSNFRIAIDGDWVWAQKKKSDVKSITYTTSTTVSAMTRNCLSRVKRKLVG
jgi:predicted O-methyltransferase YrrM